MTRHEDLFSRFKDEGLKTTVISTSPQTKVKQVLRGMNSSTGQIAVMNGRTSLTKAV